MAVIENLDIVLGARTEKLDSGLDRSTGRVQKFESDIGRIGKAAEATLAPLRDLGLSLLASVPGASAAATAFSAIMAAFTGSRAGAIATDTRAAAAESTKASAAMSAFAVEATVAAAATARAAAASTFASAAGSKVASEAQQTAAWTTAAASEMGRYAGAAAIAAAATGRAATESAFAGAAGSKVSREAQQTAAWTSAAATAMTRYAGAAMLAAVSTGRIDVPDLPRIGDRRRNAGSGGGLAVYNAATARAGARGAGLGDFVDAEFTQISTGAAGATRAIGSLGPVGIAVGATVAAAFVGAAVGAKALQVTIAGVREQMTAIDDTADAAKRLGFQFNELVTLRMAIGRSTGMDDGQIDSALSKMQLNLAEARSGSGALAEQLKTLGLDAGQLLKAGPVEAIKQISAVAQQMKSPIDQNKLAFDLAGKAGVALAQSLRDGPAAVDEAAAKAKQLGLTLSQAQTEQVGAANDAWEDMQLIATGVFRQIAAEFSPIITVISDSVVGVGSAFGGWQSALPMVVDQIAIAAGFAWDILEAFTATNRMIAQIANGDLSAAFQTATDALDFTSGFDIVKKLDEARAKAAEAAKSPRPPAANADGIEAEREASKAAAEAKKQQAADRDRDEARNKAAVADRLGGLRDEVAVLGQAASAADRLKLARQGATQSQLAEFDALSAAKQKHEDLAATMERGKEVAAQYRTPMEQFDTQLKDLNTLFSVGAIDFNTYARATRDAAKKAGGESSAAKQLKDTPTIAALQRGSVEAYSAANKNDKSATAAKLQEQANKLLEQVNVNLEAIARQRGQTLKQA